MAKDKTVSQEVSQEAPQEAPHITETRAQAEGIETIRVSFTTTNKALGRKQEAFAVIGATLADSIQLFGEDTVNSHFARSARDQRKSWHASQLGNEEITLDSLMADLLKEEVTELNARKPSEETKVKDLMQLYFTSTDPNEKASILAQVEAIAAAEKAAE